MFNLIFILIFFVIIVYCVSNKVHVKFNTFLKKGYFVDNSPYGIYCYHNKQGSGKTQSAVTFLLDNTHYRIYANLKSIKGIEYYYFSGWNELLTIGTTCSDCIIFYDELFKGFYKGKKMKDKDKEILMDFMSQMRKRHIIFITTAQEWLEIPIEFRRYVRYDIECSLFSIFGYPIIRKIFHNTELIKWDNLENEYVSPIIGTYIEHGRKKIVNSYDTFEQISSEETPPIKVFNKYSVNTYEIKNNQNNNEKNIELDYINKNNDNKIVFDFPVSQENQNNYNYKFKNIYKKIYKEILNKLLFFVKKTTSLFTTTIKRLVVNCQFTNKNKKFTHNDTSSLHFNNSNIDNDFWGSSNDNDLY